MEVFCGPLPAECGLLKGVEQDGEAPILYFSYRGPINLPCLVAGRVCQDESGD